MTTLRTLSLLGAALIFSTISPSSYGQTPEELAQRLIGEWEGLDDGEKSIVIFSANGRFQFLKGSAGIIDGQYTVDFSKTPHHLTVVSEGEIGRSIFEFLSRDKIRLAEGRDDGRRPTSFEDSTELTKQ